MPILHETFEIQPSTRCEDPPITPAQSNGTWIEQYLPVQPHGKNLSDERRHMTSKLGWCVDDQHPIFEGRALVRLHDHQESTQWLLCLMGCRPQKGDRLMLNYVTDLEQWVVCGIIDGFRERISAARQNPTLVLEPGQALTMVNLRGQPLANLSLLDDGLMVQSLGQEMALGTSGTLRLFGDDVRIESTVGNVEVHGANDAIIRGQTVRLN